MLDIADIVEENAKNLSINECQRIASIVNLRIKYLLKKEK